MTTASGRRRPRLAAGRARALGLPTRGTTAPNRLRRVDRWIIATQAARLRLLDEPLVIDLGYGSSPVTTVELYERLRAVCPQVRVLGLELDPERVAAAQPAARPPWLTFARGGFELAGQRPDLIRAMNVLRQYTEDAVEPAWRAMRGRLAPGGLLIEGTCDEIGRRSTWFALPATSPAGPAAQAGPGVTLTLSAHLASLSRPSELAERLPKALIARNVPGEDSHALLAALDDAWDRASPHAPFGPRARFEAAVAHLRAAGWPVQGTRRRWRLGELTIPWPPSRDQRPGDPA
ncbi:MAG: class I SAM-dependent methyltransferase [Frankia sp.]|nr:class I SAM-dependent methyltransferase [Frankia sp.]